MTNTVQHPPARQLDTLELAALAYLLLPLVVFLGTWLRWPVALVLEGLLGLSVWSVARHSRPAAGLPLPARLWLLAGAVALAWIALSGLAGYLPLNRDWNVRMAVLRDLTVGEWPVSYGPVEGGEAVLRFSPGYYLVPALFGKWAGVEAARTMLALWTLGGVLLFFGLVLGESAERRAPLVALLLAVLVLFSGMDCAGWWMINGDLPGYGQHIEWWNGWVQYSSQTTLLFWVPNHALPAWLLTAVVWRHRNDGLALAPAAALMLATALWSPLAGVGVAPLVLGCSLRGQPPRAWLRELFRPAVLAVLPAMLLLAKFVTFGMPPKAGDEAAGTALDQLGLTPAPVYMLLSFMLLEWGSCALVLAAAVGGARRVPWYFWIMVLELLALPLLHYGPGNDLVMRGGIAPMTLLVLAAAAALTARTTPARWRWTLALLLLLGSVTPLTEMQRATLPGSRWPDDGRSLAERAGMPWHYVGVLSSGWMQAVLREPVRLKSGDDGRARKLPAGARS